MAGPRSRLARRERLARTVARQFRQIRPKAMSSQGSTVSGCLIRTGLPGPRHRDRRRFSSQVRVERGRRANTIWSGSA